LNEADRELLRSTDATLAQMATTPDPRFREIMAAAVRHLHAFAREVNLTPEEWLKGIQFLTAVGHWERFKRGRNVASYFGLIPSEESSGKNRRLGHVSKQGNSMVRWLLVQAATIAQSKDAAWHRQYARLSMTKHHGVAKVAIAHKLAVRLYWMLRSGEDYSKVMERGSHVGQSE